MGVPEERYSKIIGKNQREICLLRGFPCAWGNGTASRESEKIISDMIHEMNLPVDYVITNEAGAL